MTFDFKSYHIRSINASDEERAVINQELKDLYASLSPEDKAIFNEQLQTFLVKEMANIGSEYAAIKSQLNNNN
ncbi:hypothetical protein BWI93_12685 [Siphonobacter sp. BAB-5385]|uniref:hypothetical protein n=1 Tax=unclassified Siphonobacter TaxID=2635712 RepID=UPI000B9EB87E|nr:MULTISPECIES: hypothetical protein [unclassified Siphonobacter]OZI07817.1 hypothetical protein BWI93_12685 [Siphonobacter sp. BAB-5385]PMD94556.1 hypothetical protein BWI97_16440 [Siphonobacter sp. BAB-5405]